MNRLGFALMILAIPMMLGGNALAQNVGDNTIYFVAYYSNANTAGASDQTVRIINDGDTSSGGLGSGNLWAAIYVFDDSEELQSCCACVVTPDGLLSESVDEDLTSSSVTVTGRTPTRGVIKVISSSSSDPTAPVPTAGLREWATHIQKANNSVNKKLCLQDPAAPGCFDITEDLAADSNLASGELALLGELCDFVVQLGAGRGLCSCTPEGHDF